MSIHLRGNAWEARYYGSDGKQRRKSFSIKKYETSAKAKRAANEYLVSQTRGIREGSWIDPSRGRVTLRGYESSFFGNQAHLKAKTLAGYRDAVRLRILPRIGDIPIASLTNSDIGRWLGTLADDGLSASSVRLHFRVLSRMLDQAVADQRIARNPAIGVKLPKLAPKNHRFLTPAEVERLATRCGEYGDVVRVLGYCGLRWGELAALKVSRVNLLHRRIDVAENVVEINGKAEWGTPKSHQSRIVPIPKSLVPIFEKWMMDKRQDQLVFAGPRGGVLRNGTFRKLAWNDAVKAPSEFEGVRIHDLRHTCASLAISSGANVKVVQRLLGHQSAAVTLDTYAGLFENDLDDVASRMDSMRNVALDEAECSTKTEAKQGQNKAK